MLRPHDQLWTNPGSPDNVGRDVLQHVALLDPGNVLQGEGLHTLVADDTPEPFR